MNQTRMDSGGDTEGTGEPPAGDNEGRGHPGAPPQLEGLVVLGGNGGELVPGGCNNLVVMSPPAVGGGAWGRGG